MLSNPINSLFSAHVASSGVNMAGFKDLCLLRSGFNIMQFNYLRKQRIIGFIE